MTEVATFTGPDGEVRVKDAELVVPIVIGTAAFHLGKKATEYSSHRWTVYVRSLDNEDLSHIVRKVVFTLHSSFQNPTREILQPPYELTEHGWGEFEILVSIHFAEDSREEKVDLLHKLRLYPEDAVGQVSKKPVVHEQLEEIVFSEPAHAFHSRVASRVRVPAPPYAVAAHFTTFNAAAEVARYNAIRQKVAQMRANVQRQLDLIH